MSISFGEKRAGAAFAAPSSEFSITYKNSLSVNLTPVKLKGPILTLIKHQIA